MLLSEILKELRYASENFREIDVEDIVYDSRRAKENTLFVALVGAYSDGHDYVDGAYLAGARAFLVERPVALPADAVQLVVDDSRAALAVVSATFFGHPERELKIIGVTGTKGKTSIAGMLGACLNRAGVKTGTIGTVGAYYNGKIVPTLNTTPESYECMKLFRAMADAGNVAVVMEVSSLGLKAHRVDRIRFDAAIFTNLSPDHIGGKEHESFEEYAYWKRQLFHKCAVAVLNADDPYWRTIAAEIDCPVVTYALDEEADYTAEKIEKTHTPGHFGARFTLKAPHGVYENCSTAVPGLFSVSNALAAFAVCDVLRVKMDAAIEGMRHATVIGRNDCLKLGLPYSVIIDYAHNGASFNAVLDAFLAYPHNRVITVFGSVGDRAFLRRREVGTVSGARADLSVVTSDDPGFEDPKKICDEIAAYVREAGGEAVVIPDRREAVFYALDHAEAGDVVLLLGKGHETAQKVMGQKVHYSDYETVEEYIKRKEKR